MLGCRHHSVARPIGNELLHDPSRRQPRARQLEVLEVGGRGLELCLQSLVPPPLAIARTREDHREYQRGAHHGG